MIATTAQAATTEVVYVIPLGWTVALGALIFLAAGALIGAWLTTEATRTDVEDRIDRGIRSGLTATLSARAELERRPIVTDDDEAALAVALLLDRLGGEAEITLEEIVNLDRDRTVWRTETFDGIRLTTDRTRGVTR